jgi:DNA helicase-2/ATP-dependent DNA helicase PcrA
MTRAREELTLTHARLREFRGQTLYAVPSMFLDELPAGGVERIDLGVSAAGTLPAMQAWRGGGAPAARQGWIDAGLTPRPAQKQGSEPGGEPTSDGGPGGNYVEGMLVRHETYGTGRVTEVSGYGALRKVKVRFASAGERTFLTEKAKLAMVRQG